MSRIKVQRLIRESESRRGLRDARDVTPQSATDLSDAALLQWSSSLQQYQHVSVDEAVAAAGGDLEVNDLQVNGDLNGHDPDQFVLTTGVIAANHILVGSGGGGAEVSPRHLIMPFPFTGLNDNTAWTNAGSTHYADYGRCIGLGVLKADQALAGVQWNCRLLGYAHKARLLGMTGTETFPAEIFTVTPGGGATTLTSFTVPVSTTDTTRFLYQKEWAWSDALSIAAGDYVGIEWAGSRFGTWDGSNNMSNHAIVLTLGILLSEFPDTS